jgi:hypothetical protein
VLRNGNVYTKMIALSTMRVKYQILKLRHEFGQAPIGRAEPVEARRQKLILGIRLPFDRLTVRAAQPGGTPVRDGRAT